MGKRRSKVVIAAILLTFCLGIAWLFANYQQFQAAVKNDRDYVLANLIEEGALTETQVIALMNHEVDEETLAKGLEMAEKYGFTDELTNQQKLIQSFSMKNFAIAAFTFSLILLLIIWQLQISRKREKNLLAHVEEYQEKKELLELQLQRKVLEDDNIKSSVTDIAHQLKTPVASLKLSMEIALSDEYSPEERQSFKEQTEIQVNKLDLMLDGMVKISQLESDLISLQPQEYSLKKLMEEIISSLIMKAIEKDIEIEMLLDLDVTVLIDRKWTREAIGNVLENAIKYSPPQTTITIRLNALVTYALVEIIDEGPGISKEEVSRIYQRFYRGPQAEDSEVEGSGVGLYLTRKIIEGQGGAIIVHPSKPRGSNFQLTLPLAK